MRKTVLWASLLFFAMFCSGCCTIFGGGSQMITINSNPPGANVQVGNLQGVTPYQVKLNKGKDYAIRVTCEGETQAVQLEKRVDGVFWINILFWPGLIIDAATGSIQI